MPWDCIGHEGLPHRVVHGPADAAQEGEDEEVPDAEEVEEDQKSEGEGQEGGA